MRTGAGARLAAAMAAIVMLAAVTASACRTQPTTANPTTSPTNRDRDSNVATIGTEAHEDIHVGSRVIRVSARLGEPSVIAGGPLVVVWNVRSTDGDPAYFALGGDRAKGRLAHMSYAAETPGVPSASFADPAGDMSDLGGPLGVQTVTSDGRDIPVLVNEFLTLERAQPAVATAVETELLLTCHWDIAVATDHERVLRPEAIHPVTLRLRIRLQRDDGALRALVRSQLAAVLATSTQDADALAAVVALRYPDTPALVTELGGTPQQIAWVSDALAASKPHGN